MIVVDTNVLSYFWLPGDYTENAKSLLRHDLDWIVPQIWKSEFRNVLALYVRKKLITESIAIEIMSKAENALKEMAFSVHSREIISLFLKCSLSAYNLEYVVLAESMGIPLITMDKKILNEFPDLAIPLIQY